MTQIIKIKMGKYFYCFFILFLFTFPTLSAQNPNPKIASLSPGITQIIFKLNRKDYMVGRSSACGFIKGTENIPIIGDMGIPNIEALMIAKPDVVIVSALKDNSSAVMIRNLGIKMYVLPVDTINEYYKTVEELGTILGAEKEASEEINRIKTGLCRFENGNRNTPIEKRPTVFLEIWDSPLMSAGGKSFLTDFIFYAGGKNIASDINRNYFGTTKEWVVSQNPQIIIAPFMSENSKKALKNSFGWSSISAVRNDKIFNNLDPNQIYILGPDMLQIIEQIHQYVATIYTL